MIIRCNLLWPFPVKYEHSWQKRRELYPVPSQMWFPNNNLTEPSQVPVFDWQGMGTLFGLFRKSAPFPDCNRVIVVIGCYSLDLWTFGLVGLVGFVDAQPCFSLPLAAAGERSRCFEFEFKLLNLYEIWTNSTNGGYVVHHTMRKPFPVFSWDWQNLSIPLLLGTEVRSRSITKWVSEVTNIGFLQLRMWIVGWESLKPAVLGEPHLYSGKPHWSATPSLII